jgi:hypothetical protein
VRFRETQGWGAVLGAALAACAGTLTRYEGWFLLPFAAAYFFFTARRHRAGVAALFCAIAGAGPLYWLFHNWWIAGDPLDFLRGPYSAKAIQAGHPYPGQGHWAVAWLYYRTAVRLCAGPVLAITAIGGVAALLFKRAFWPLVLLALPPVFYLWSLHSSGTPIHVPELWPHSWYNTRYGLAALPLMALAGAALVAIAPPRLRNLAAVLVVAAGASWWIVHPSPRSWITWDESRMNSENRRAGLHEAAAYLQPRYVPGSGIFTSVGDDFAGTYREMGIPLRETFGICNGLPWEAAIRRPELFLWQEWAVVRRGDEAQTALERAALIYTLELTIVKDYEPVIEIYRRTGGPHGPP